MTDFEKELIKESGMDVADFEPSTEDVTVKDLVEALDILTTIVLGGE